ncbi:MAG TPA: hypothetical protein VGI78_20540 [Acetobacteraceae bacterium]
MQGDWGEFKNYRDHLDAVNNELVVVPMIATNQSLENLDDIASVPGVDVLLIGRLIFRSSWECRSTTSATSISERSIKSRRRPRNTASPPGYILVRPEWTRTSSSRRGQLLHHAMEPPGRRLGSRTPWPGSSANDVDAGLANSRTAPTRAADQLFRHAGVHDELK